MVGLPTNKAMRMLESGTTRFGEAAEYQCAFGGIGFKLTVTGSGNFNARLTWKNLHHLQVLRGYENLARIAYISLPPSRCFVSFPTGEARLIYDGIELQPGDLVFHRRGERMHQRTAGNSRWGLMSLPPTQLAHYRNSPNGRKIISPPVGRVLRPQRVAATRLLRAHAKVCYLAEAKDKSFAQPEAATLEHELLDALADCLRVEDMSDKWVTRRRRADIMSRFEDALTATDRQFTIPGLCAAIGVRERTFRVCCNEFLGMNPTRYVLLRRMNMARAALRRADPKTVSVAEIARSCQFSELGRFAVTYRTVFGELPSATLRSTPGQVELIGNMPRVRHWRVVDHR